MGARALEGILQRSGKDGNSIRGIDSGVPWGILEGERDIPYLLRLF